MKFLFSPLALTFERTFHLMRDVCLIWAGNAPIERTKAPARPFRAYDYDSLIYISIEFYKSLLASCKVLLLVCLRQVCDKWKTRAQQLCRDPDTHAPHCILIPGMPRCDVLEEFLERIHFEGERLTLSFQKHFKEHVEVAHKNDRKNSFRCELFISKMKNYARKTSCDMWMRIPSV